MVHPSLEVPGANLSSRPSTSAEHQTVITTMNLNKLETRFFDRIINAELDVPVHATLKYRDTSLDLIVVPKIAPQGYLRFEYFNASAYHPEPQVGPDGTPYIELTSTELAGTHPLLEEAWQKRADVKLELKPSRLPIAPKANLTLDARVLYADHGNRGVLVLHASQTALRDSPLRKAEFSISSFADFRTPEKLWSSIGRVVSDESQPLQITADRLGDSAQFALSPVSHNIILDTGNGWRITLTKDEHSEDDAVSHTGVVEKPDGTDFRVDQLREVLEGLRYFFAFTMVQYCFPSVIIGYDASGRVAYGEPGEFGARRQNPLNWFHHDRDERWGNTLELFFPRFWRRWQSNKDELIAVIDAYVSSQAMRRAGILRDAVAKSCGGLEIIAGLVLGRTIRNTAREDFDKVLRCYKIPHRHLDAATNPVTQKLCSDLNIPDDNGARLLVDVRNYVAHPLDKNPVIKPGHLQYVDGDRAHYVHLHDLSQFYLEHVLLRFCGLRVARHRQLLEFQRR